MTNYNINDYVKDQGEEMGIILAEDFHRDELENGGEYEPQQLAEKIDDILSRFAEIVTDNYLERRKKLQREEFRDSLLQNNY